MSLRNKKTIQERREYIEKLKGVSLHAIGVFPKGLEEAQNKNCENMVGATSVPLGVAGPLLIHGEYAQGEYYLPLATTEAALVASVNRGCKAITAAGGVEVVSHYAGMTRAPVFKTGSLRDGKAFQMYIQKHSSDLTKIASATSSHLTLISINTQLVGTNVYVRLSFDTTDAMGMNMVTNAADIIAKHLEKRCHVRCIAVGGNFDVDKKPSWLNIISGRGRQVWAQVTLAANVTNEVLKTTPQKIHQVVIDKCLIGSAISGTMGFNAHFANVLAAIFIACGQDAAHISEGSCGITTTELHDGALCASIFLPDLPVGTIGGGTSLPTQKEALSLLGVFGGDKGRNASSFAEIVAGAVLAGELSLLSAFASGTLASSHQKLAGKLK